MRASAAFAGLALSIGTLVPVAGTPGIACADEQPRAVLVVDTGARDLSYCVALDDDTVSGIDLIVLAGRQHGLPYRLGYGGAAVCMLAGVGTSGDDCFEEYPNFWGYWRGNGSGGWAWSGSGAASTSVSDGDVEGWSWGSGDDGDSHPAPPPTSFGDVCDPLPEPMPTKLSTAPKKDKRQGANDAAAAEPPGPSQSPASPASRPPDSRIRPKRTTGNQGRSGAGELVAGVTNGGSPPRAPKPTVVAAEPASDKGPPAAGLGALAAAAVLVAAGGFGLVRRRRAR
jgi:hypothetical protein